MTSTIIFHHEQTAMRAMLKDKVVRVVGIEPTLLSEPDFEWDRPALVI
jgi:hypothetical protein